MRRRCGRGSGPIRARGGPRPRRGIPSLDALEHWYDGPGCQYDRRRNSRKRYLRKVEKSRACDSTIVPRWTDAVHCLRLGGAGRLRITASHHLGGRARALWSRASTAGSGRWSGRWAVPERGRDVRDDSPRRRLRTGYHRRRRAARWSGAARSHLPISRRPCESIDSGIAVAVPEALPGRRLKPREPSSGWGTAEGGFRGRSSAVYTDVPERKASVGTGPKRPDHQRRRQRSRALR